MKRAPLVALLLLAACGKQVDSQKQLEEAAKQPAAAAPLPSTSREPAKVMIAWATAITMRDWPLVRAYWGDKGERSGLSPQQFAGRWDRLLTPRVSIGDGQQEGAAGSLYYTAPVTIVDGPNRLHGNVVLRRVNDVPGATPEQLRWHIESSTLIP